MEDKEKAASGNSKTRIILIALITAAFVMVIVLLGMHYMNTKKRFHNKNLGYTLEFDSAELKYQEIVLNNTDNVRMDRFGVVGSEDLYYLSVSTIDVSTDLDEALEAFESDESYSFTRENDVTFGSGNYHARRISYEDKTGVEPVKVTYYFDSNHGLFFTVCTDEAHRGLLEKALSTVAIEDRD